MIENPIAELTVGGESGVIRRHDLLEKRLSMTSAIRSVLLSFLFALTNAHLLPSQSDYATPILAGISNHGQNTGEPYATAGDRTYLIGTQDGNFPDMGQLNRPGIAGGSNG
jgi:hypothetical protein